MIFQSYGIKKTKFSLHYIILIFLILHFPQFYIYFRQPLKKCKTEVSLYNVQKIWQENWSIHTNEIRKITHHRTRM
jgi:hypothetical protein